MHPKHSNVIGCGNDINDNNYNKNTEALNSDRKKIQKNPNSKRGEKKRKKEERRE